MFDINAKRGYQESVFLQALGINLSDLEPKADMCTKVGNSNISILTADSDELFLKEVSQRKYLQDYKLLTGIPGNTLSKLYSD